MCSLISNFVPKMEKNLYIISGCNGAGKTTASAIDFYRKNGFKELTKKEEDDHSRQMFFDMMDVL